ncbi:DUF2924 domain-containing protein [Aquamicrobium defluvii]|uniref:DUF2924 family protein n=1 Tax=Aquamicrobium defluvii TaxID=69279 RepID=A0A011TXR2_9HYPH|nr:DUF2924 domain-containing protein [Aquamicrobium defluvii]EXL08932.1 hypothetical protein BG36_02405 [Aquamicrobium defluvii]EZQ16129.1 hypothetical protein CF98_41775 [Halopseudomonas bauzanensis]
MSGTTKQAGPRWSPQHESATADVPVLARLAALKRMSVKELKAEWEALFAEPAPNNSRGYLELRLAWRIQELSLGGLSRETRKVLDLLADEIDGKSDRKAIIADPRNPVAGTRLVREWEGVEHTVTVMKDGFDWQGRKFKSLSAVAKAITGTQWNGYRFFGLRERKQERA